MGVGIAFTIIAGVMYFSRINIVSYEVHIYTIFIMGIIAFSLEIVQALRMYNSFRDYIHSVVLAWDFYFAKCDAIANKRKENEN